MERRLRSDWAPSTLVPNDPCPLTKDNEGLCIEAKKEKNTLASTRDEAGCPLCGHSVNAPLVVMGGNSSATVAQ